MGLLDIIGCNSVTINGDTYSGDVSIVNGIVVVDGVSTGKTLHYKIEVVVHGDVGSVSTMSGNVKCLNVTGDIKTMSGDVHCETVAGRVKTMSGDIINYHN